MCGSCQVSEHRVDHNWKHFQLWYLSYSLSAEWCRSKNISYPQTSILRARSKITFSPKCLVLPRLNYTSIFSSLLFESCTIMAWKYQTDEQSPFRGLAHCNLLSHASFHNNNNNNNKEKTATDWLQSSQTHTHKYLLGRRGFKFWINPKKQNHRVSGFIYTKKLQYFMCTLTLQSG